MKEWLRKLTTILKITTFFIVLWTGPYLMYNIRGSVWAIAPSIITLIIILGAIILWILE